MAVPSQLDVLRDVVKRLESVDIAYMLTSSLAMSYFAVPRMTRDIDLVVELPDDMLDAFARSFAETYYLPPDLAKSAKRCRMFNLIHLEAMSKVDIVPRRDNEYRRTEFRRRQRVDLAGSKVWIVAVEDLILSKLIWITEGAGGLQKSDVLTLMEAELNRPYLDHWVGRLGLEVVLRDISGA